MIKIYKTLNSPFHQDHLYYCARNNLSPLDSQNTKQPCLGLFGGPAFTNLAFGGYQGTTGDLWVTKVKPVTWHNLYLLNSCFCTSAE